MTVKCLSPEAKTSIADMFSNHTMSATDLSVFWLVSRRTIIRVLEEKGIDPGVKHRTPKPNSYYMVSGADAVRFNPNVLTDVPVLGLDQRVIPMQTTSLDDALPQKSWVKRFFRSLRDAMAIY